MNLNCKMPPPLCLREFAYNAFICLHVWVTRACASKPLCSLCYMELLTQNLNFRSIAITYRYLGAQTAYKTNKNIPGKAKIKKYVPNKFFCCYLNVICNT